MSNSSRHSIALTEGTYRPDIDGLRAIAVISVVGFHAFPDWVKGGFIGVDIFFVISGYLISTIIIGGLAAGRFSFVKFYSRRIRRIFPALLVVLAICLALGWVVLLSDEYSQLGKHVFGGAGFISNLILWRESNYFDTAAYTKPLLHLWSLGVEEQFYLAWPLILWAAWNWRANLAVLTIAIIAVSFSLNVVLTESDRVAAFYSPLTRFWELMTGSLLAYLTLFNRRSLQINGSRFALFANKIVDAWQGNSRKLNNCVSVVGASLIAVGVATISREKAFPGWWALLPTLGAALLISAGAKAWLNSRFLANRFLVWIGLISYPLYLWHWPLLSLERIIEGQRPAAAVRATAVVISIATAWATYRLIEKPLRFGESLGAKALVLLSLMVAIGLTGIAVHDKNGLPFRQVVAMNLNDGFEGGDNGVAVSGCGVSDSDKRLFAVCAHDPRGEDKYALLGDSKAASLFGGLVRTSSEQGRWLFIGGNNGNGAPVPVLSNDKIYAPYQKLTSIALTAIKDNKNLETVLLVAASATLLGLHGDDSIEDMPNSAYYDVALQSVDNVVSQLIGAGKKVVLLVDNPTLPDPKDCLDRKVNSAVIAAILPPQTNGACTITIARHLKLSEKYTKLLAQIASRHPNQVTIFDTLKYMCDVRAGVCPAYMNGRMLYSYTYHVSDYAAGMIGRDLNLYLSDR
jgi:peptidoglycan/LPS O-acetylase OafA/YrhL